MIETVQLGKTKITLVGTAHVSQRSVEDVKRTIAKEKPDVVAIELDEKRYAALQNPDHWKNMEVRQILKDGKTYLFLINLILANFQKRLGKELGVMPGAEMMAAAEEAKKIGARVEFVDRDIQITLRRAFRTMSTWEKIKVLGSLFMNTLGGDVDAELIESMKDKDVLSEALREIGQIVPTAKRVLVDERDTYMATKISELGAKNVVAVLGAGHVPGIQKKLSEKPSIAGLDELPPRKNWLKYVSYLIPLFFVSIFAYGVYTKGLDVAMNLLLYWFLINGTLAAIGTALALGHPASILAAFLAAPFTSLNPAIAAGWVAGYVEAHVRNPKVKDFEQLNALDGWKAYWKNGVTRILLVVVFANLGSTIGTFVALPYLLGLLG